MSPKKEISLKTRVLSKNDQLAQKLRERFKEEKIRCINMIGSPGSGKTSLLETAIPRLKAGTRCAVVEGDVKTDNDARRILKAGAPSVQIETEGGCHLNGEQVIRAIGALSLNSINLLIIENVGNLICPVSYDLGEEKRVIVSSITEGDDKPLKYPSAFTSSQALIITKVDLAPYVDAKVEKLKNNALSLNPKLEVFCTSSRSGEGFNALVRFLQCNGPKENAVEA